MGALTEKGRTLDLIERVPYRDAFLIGDLLTSRITILAGEPKSGKTLLAVGMATAMINGEPDFLGLPVHRKAERVVFGLTDDGAEEEIKERFRDAVPDAAVVVFPVERTGVSGYWGSVRDDLTDHGADLFVLDNVVGALAPGDDIAASPTAQRVVDNLKPISRAGVPVLTVTHTPKGSGEGFSVASAPIGGRAIAGGARGIIALRRSARDGRRVQTAINRATQDLDLDVTVRRRASDSEVPVWAVRSVSPGPTADPDPWDELVTRIVDDQPAADSLTRLGDLYADTTSWSPSTIRQRLRGRVTHDTQRWVRAA